MRGHALIGMVLASCLLASGCDQSDSSTGPSTSPATPGAATSAPSGVCERLAAKLDGATARAHVYERAPIPVFDWCELEQKSNQILVGVSVLPSTDADLTAARRAWDGGHARRETPSQPVDVGDGGWGVESLNKAFITFLRDGRLVRLVDQTGFVANEIAFLSSIGEKVDLAGLPAPPANVERPECARGTAAARRSLGAEVLIRRDVMLEDGYLICVWATRNRTVRTSSAGPGSHEEMTFRYYSEYADDPPSTEFRHIRVPVAGNGVYEASTGVVFRAADKVFVLVRSEPYYTVSQEQFVALAKAIVPIYQR